MKATTSENPHAGLPFDDDDAAIAAALEDVSIPALMCSLVHITGDPTWIRGDIRPLAMGFNEYQGSMPAEMMAEARRQALPLIAAYRDAGCPTPPALDGAVVHEMMSYLVAVTVADEFVPMFVEDLQLDGTDVGAPRWGDEISADVRAASPVIVIGCGEAGLVAGIRLKQAGLPFILIEKNGGPGGTWWENRYPGARVDIGSHYYCYSFEPADHWTEYFSQHPELRAYFEHVMAKYGIAEHCRFNTTVTALTYDDESGRWSVSITNPDGSAETLDARAVISAVGSLNQIRLPEIPGIDEFNGPWFHSARWPQELDITGKRVALVGAGASGFQIAPTIADQVAQLTVFQRTAQWMFPNMNYHRAVPPGETWAMRHLPFYARWFRFLTFYPGAGLNIEGFRVDPNFDDSDGMAINAANRKRREVLTQWFEKHIGDRPDLMTKTIPDYPASAKRILQDNGSWLNCLRKPNVELVRTTIERVVADGIVTVDGTHYPADIICYATGFRHNDFLWPMQINGRAGVDLREQWGDEPTAYVGITIPNFPNLFCLYGPGTNLAQGANLIYQSECQMTYVMDALHELLSNGHKAMEPRQDVHDEYRKKYEHEISQMIWAHWSVKHSHYKNPDGKIYTLSPWTIPTYWRWMQNFNANDYTYA